MTTHTRLARARRDRAQLLNAGIARLDRISAGHPDHLTPADAGLLAALFRAHQADAEQTERHRLGLARAQSAGIEKLKAAEAAIREAEQDLDSLVSAVWSAVHIADEHDVTDWQRGYRSCACRVLTVLGHRPAQIIREERTLTDEQMAELATIVNRRPRSNVQIIGTHPA